MSFLLAAAPAVSAVLGAAGTAASAYGAYQGGMFKAQVAENNAKTYGQNAAYSIAAGQEAAANKSMEGAAKVAALKAGQAASGVDVNSPSAVAAQVGARGAENLDAETLFNNYGLQAYTDKTQQANEEAQAKQDKQGAWLGVASSLISGASSIATKWGGSGGSSGGGSSAAPSADLPNVRLGASY